MRIEKGINKLIWQEKFWERIAMLMVLGGLGAYLVVPSMQALWGSAGQTDWRAVEATVTRTDILRDTRYLGTNTPRYVFEYEYEVDGQLHRSRRYSFINASFGASDGVERFAVGETIMAYYDPDAPQNALVERGMAGISIYFALIVGVLMLAIAAAPLVDMFIMREENQHAAGVNKNFEADEKD